MSKKTSHFFIILLSTKAMESVTQVEQSMFRTFECGICLEAKDCLSVTCNNLLYGFQPDRSNGCGYRICFTDYVAMTQTGRSLECPICKKEWERNILKSIIKDCLIKESPHVDSKTCGLEDCYNFVSKRYGCIMCHFHEPRRYTCCGYEDANGEQSCYVFVDSGDDNFTNSKPYYCSQHAKYKSSGLCLAPGCNNMIPLCCDGTDDYTKAFCGGGGNRCIRSICTGPASGSFSCDSFVQYPNTKCNDHLRYSSSFKCVNHPDCQNQIVQYWGMPSECGLCAAPGCGCESCKRTYTQGKLLKLKRKLFIDSNEADPIDFLSGEYADHDTSGGVYGPSEEEKMFIERQARLKREIENKWLTVVKTLKENPSSNVKFDINIVID